MVAEDKSCLTLAKRVTANPAMPAEMFLWRVKFCWKYLKVLYVRFGGHEVNDGTQHLPQRRIKRYDICFFFSRHTRSTLPPGDSQIFLVDIHNF